MQQKLKKTSVEEIIQTFEHGEYITEDGYMDSTIEQLQNKIPRQAGIDEMYKAFLVGAGSGAGKSRLLIEIFKYYVEKEKKTVVLPITFGGDGIFGADIEEGQKKFAVAEKNSKLFVVVVTTNNLLFVITKFTNFVKI